MKGKVNGKSFFKGFVFGLICLSILFTTCDQPLGFGDIIDFEAPFLELDPIELPAYVSNSAVIEGSIWDAESAISTVFMRDQSTGATLFTAQLLPGTGGRPNERRFKFTFNFTPDQNDTVIRAEIVGRDRYGNDGGTSIAAITLVVDLKPPLIDSVQIQRTPSRFAYLESYATLKNLESVEKEIKRQVPGSANMYQNGMFYINMTISEAETRIKDSTSNPYVKIYHAVQDGSQVVTTLIKEIDMHPSSVSRYNPKFLINEADLLAAGETVIGAGYTAAYNSGTRYYYKVDVAVVDSSGNQNESIQESQGFFCMWKDADRPQGFIDPIIASSDPVTVQRGSSIPVILFDDDVFEVAYVDMLRREQWGVDEAAGEDIGSGFILSAGTDEQKLAQLSEHLLLGGTTILNWEKKVIQNIAASEDITEMTHLVQTGNSESDYGDYVLFAVLRDKKLDPHTGDLKAAQTYAVKWNISVIDENAPIIIFDVTGGTPEENTFPALEDGQFFTIRGYTLRENGRVSTGDNEGRGTKKVSTFKVAWIPSGMPGGASSHQAMVREALQSNTPGATMPEGVQWWDFSANFNINTVSEDGGTSYRHVKIGESWVIEQLFEKRFDIRGETDDVSPSGVVPGSPSYKNFHYDGSLENETKLFIFYAQDDMGNFVFRQYKILGNKNRPQISVYSITDRSIPGLPSSPPNPALYSADGSTNNPAYMSARRGYNTDPYVYSALREVSLSGTLRDSDLISESFKIYPRGSTLKFWVMAERDGDLAVRDIIMEDTTFNPVTTIVGDSANYIAGVDEHGQTVYYPILGSAFDPNDRAMSYIEYFPEIDRRVFKFTAVDTLGNIGQIEKTFSITSAATLSNITTVEQNGTYPAGKEIIIRANFDGPVRLQNNTGANRPILPVHYEINGVDTWQEIECDELLTESTLSLIFRFTVPDNATGQLTTISNAGSPGGSASYDRPLIVNPANRIIDATRTGEDHAFTPGNVEGFTWSDDRYSLQAQKKIELDGIAPLITNLEIGGKDSTTVGSFTDYYFKDGETLTFTLKGSELIKTSGESITLSYRLIMPNGTTTTAQNRTAFVYQRPGEEENTLVFVLPVNTTSIPVTGGQRIGQIENISLFTENGNIIDDVGNPVVASTVTAGAFNTLLGTNRIFFDLTPPPQPLWGTHISMPERISTSGQESNPTFNYNESPVLTFNEILTTPAASSAEPYGSRRQYSLNGGMDWKDFPDVRDDWTTYTGGQLRIKNGQWTLKTRYIDMAGNTGSETTRLLHINQEFPKLLGINGPASGTYTAGSTLTFTMNFDEIVSVVDASAVTIRLADTETTTNTPGGTITTTPTTVNTYEIVLTASVAENSRAINFVWTNAQGKDMLKGLRVTNINLTGLRDRFGNTPAGITFSYATDKVTVTTPPESDNYDFDYNLGGILVSTITPTIRTYSPGNMRSGGAAGATDRTGNITADFTDLRGISHTSSVSSDNKTITLTFSKPMQRGNGIITIKPHGNYAIPPVFENEGYTLYLNATEDTVLETKDAVVGETLGYYPVYIQGFFEIFHNLDTAGKTALIGSTNFGSPSVSNQTGLSVGPYLRTTHGLVQGAGYSGNYNNAASTANPSVPNDPTQAWSVGSNAPGPRGDQYMVPDTNTKWVLRYDIDNIRATTSVVAAIRKALTDIKWRWQEISVNESNVSIIENTVTITLPEPLLPGLQWAVEYPEGTFQDTTGNAAPAMTSVPESGPQGYWFWSKGVQKPVIRVDRKSSDARSLTGNFNGEFSNTNMGYTTSTTSGAVNNINSFNTINYRVESETPGAQIFYNTINGRTFYTTGGRGGIIGLWEGRVTETTPPTNVVNTVNITWNGPKATPARTTGTWVRPNLIFRNRDNGNENYSFLDNDGVTISRNVLGGAAADAFYGFRSHNRDARIIELNNLNLNVGGALTPQTASFTYEALEARKDYVAAEARIDHTSTSYTNPTFTSLRGYEGVFRTVIAINQNDYTTADTPNPMKILGTDRRSAEPRIIGFPIKDNAQAFDARFMKLPHRAGTQYTWVTTEIVSQFYIQIHGNGTNNTARTHLNAGDNNDWLTAGYGDLSFTLRLRTH